MSILPDKTPSIQDLTTEQRREIAVNLFPDIQWVQGADKGHIPCPGKHLHTGENKPTDCTVFCDTEGGNVPTVTCYHESCHLLVEPLAKAFQSALWKAKMGRKGAGSIVIAKAKNTPVKSAPSRISFDPVPLPEERRGSPGVEYLEAMFSPGSLSRYRILCLAVGL